MNPRYRGCDFLLGPGWLECLGVVLPEEWRLGPAGTAGYF